MKRRIKKSHDVPKSCDSLMRLGERYDEVEYRGL